ncbi:uncharacterized protein OCT59_014640 [Rhizophagus irregularis]|uniref:uncharacterized protein n=1 Tax=Rhizophagus irregularis TaxID=588596 RepID=UPI003332B968|nr:hypothetical protein OCT59_014640 [Rhizophagus irregularis]
MTLNKALRKLESYLTCRKRKANVIDDEYSMDRPDSAVTIGNEKANRNHVILDLSHYNSQDHRIQSFSLFFRESSDLISISFLNYQIQLSEPNSSKF